MAKCKWCDKKGFFLSVDKDGLCKSCLNIISQEANQRIQIIQDSKTIIEESRNPSTISSRVQTIIDHCSFFKKYSEKGIEVFSIPIAELIEETAKEGNERITNLFYYEYQKYSLSNITLKTVLGKAKSKDRYMSKGSEYISFLARI